MLLLFFLGGGVWGFGDFGADAHTLHVDMQTFLMMEETNHLPLLKFNLIQPLILTTKNPLSSDHLTTHSALSITQNTLTG